MSQMGKCKVCGCEEFVHILEMGPAEIRGLCETCMNEKLEKLGKTLCDRCDNNLVPVKNGMSVSGYTHYVCEECSGDHARYLWEQV